MGMPATPDVTRRWTAEQVRAMQDETRAWPRYELIDGELLVTPGPAPLHQLAVFRLARLLADYVDANGLGEVLTSPADLELEPGTVLQPDVFVVPAGGEPLRRSWQAVRSLLLAVDVLSPSSVRYDRITKRRFFLRVGVPEYWVVDVDLRAMERWRVGDDRSELLDERLTWHPPGAAEPFTLDLRAFFARVHRDG